MLRRTSTPPTFRYRSWPLSNSTSIGPARSVRPTTSGCSVPYKAIARSGCGCVMVVSWRASSAQVGPTRRLQRVGIDEVCRPFAPGDFDHAGQAVDGNGVEVLVGPAQRVPTDDDMVHRKQRL